jgi:hypothetical protein
MSDDLEDRLRDALRRRGEPDPLVLRRLSGELAALPPRRPYRRRGLAAAAVVVLALAALAAPRLGQVASDPGPTPSAMADRLDPDVYGDPAPWAGTDRYASCLESAGTLDGAATIRWAFEVKPARDFGRHFPAAGNVPELAGSDDVAFVAVLNETLPLLRPGPSGAGAERSLGPYERNVCVVLGSDPATYERFYIEYVDITGFRVRIDDPSAISSPQPSPSWALGCGPSSLGISYEAYASPGTQFGWPPDSPVSVFGTVVDDFRDIEVTGYEPLQPSDPGARRLRLILVQPEVNNVALVYSRLPIAANDTEAELLAMGALVLNQRPFSGQDGDFVLGIVPYDDWRVEVGPYSAALVLGSPTAAGIRPFGLYWADGDREWILHGGGPARPEDLVDLARSIYC